MNIPIEVLLTYISAIVWVIVTIWGVKKNSFTASIVIGIALLLSLNIRYLIDGAPNGIAFFVSLYDVFDNLGLSAGETAPALATCPGNNCSTWGEQYLNHSSWGVAFYDRFANGPEFRSTLLYLHLAFNSIVFVLMHYQIARPATADNRGTHRLLGRVSFAFLTIGTICAVWLASEHGPVAEYGGNLSKYGFWFMSLCVYSCAVMGVAEIRNGNAAAHRIWMIRFAGSMWGAFWIFRLMLVVTGPLLRNWESASILMSIWLSAPIGILIAEVWRRKLERAPAAARTAAQAI
ncbi:MAG: DUF2306 domain-containing protein [Gammaproteobacteria bacterium]